MPAQRLVLDAKIVEAALERLELAVGFAIEVEPDLVEVPQAAIDRQVAAPIVGIAGQRDAGARLDGGDAIGAGTDRSGHRGFLEGRGIDRVPRQDRHQAEDQRQFAVIGAAEIEPHRERVGRLGLGDLGIILAVIGAAPVAQQRPGKQHVVGRDRLAVGEARPGVEVEGDIAARVVGLDAFGQQAVERESLVIAARHQALDHKAPDLLNGEAADDQGIEAVEGSEEAPDQPAALRRIGIGVGHMGEAGGQGRRAVHRQRVAFGRLCFAERCKRRYTQREGDTRQHTQADTPADGHRQAGI